jgi:TATA-box binding protein (TBP) (component of TFIID and TFIIIB)
MIEIVNVVGGGGFKIDLDLHKIASNSSLIDMDYEPEIHSGFKFKFDEDGPTVMLFSSGNFHITGAKSVEELYQTHTELKTYIEDISDENDLDYKADCEVRNIVAVNEYSSKIDLEALSDALEESDYNPDDMPAIRFSIGPNYGTFLIYRTGKVIYTGDSDLKNISNAFDDLFKILDELFNST